MNQNEKRESFRVLFLIATPKLAQKAANMFSKENVPIQYQFNAAGTASSEMIDILGLGNPDKTILISVLPKHFANELLHKLRVQLKLGTVNSGIAFTIPLTGANRLILHMLEPLKDKEDEAAQRKDEITMSEIKYVLITAIVNQGYSDEVMDAARAAGASGGTLVHSRRIGNREALGLWGMGIQEEKEILFIVAKGENKLEIMKAIGDKYGMHSDAKGIVLSLPIDMVLGIE